MADEEKYLYAFRRRVYNLHLIQISARYTVKATTVNRQIHIVGLSV